MENDLRTALEKLTVDELKTHARKLNVAGLSALTTKSAIITAILDCDESAIRKRLRLTWIDHHRLGILLGIIGIALTVAFGIFALPYWWSPNQRPNIQQLNEYGRLTLNLERRYAIQSAELDNWLTKTIEFKQRYSSDNPHKESEYDQFIDEFTQFAERNLTPIQIKCFNEGFGSGAGGEMFAGIDELKSEHQECATQLGLIQFYLEFFIKYNRKNEEPTDPEDMSI